MLKIYIVDIALIFAVILAPAGCYADKSDDQSVKTMSGTVTSSDWVGSVMVVDNIKFSVPSNIPVRKGNDDISVSEINNGDGVIVRYKVLPSGILEAISITVEYYGDFPV